MDFTISDDRRMLSDTLRRYLADRYAIGHRNSVAYDAPWHDPEKWSQMCDLGVLYALAPEDLGGMGGTGFDVAVVFEELGRALCPEPVLAALLAIRTLAATGDVPEDLVSGAARYALAIGEPDAPDDMADLATRIESDRLSGRKSVVYGGADADVAVVAAWKGDRIVIAPVAMSDPGVTRHGYGMIDGGPAAELFLDVAAPTVLNDENDAPIGIDALEDARDWGALALSAEALGAMEIAFAMLRDHLATRTQFGRPIGSFQALQHRAVDLSIEIEQARSIVILAASAMGTRDQQTRVSQCKHLVGTIARRVAEEVIQMHGGIAMTWDYPVSHYAKRLVMLDHQLGDSDWHLDRMMRGLQAG
jgi:alkylation response protein AidB-like acyl-CoA dehydrogenase